MNFIIAALLLGLAGSLHCIGMCGPLVVAIHSRAGGSVAFSNRVVYHIGRVLVYAVLGLVVGIIGSTFSFFGWQQVLSVVAGLLMLFFVIFPSGIGALKKKPLGLISFLKNKFNGLIQRKSFWSYALLGIINGLLPCGLVYTAMAAALTTASVYKSVLFMLLFGLATAPALFAAAQAIQWIMNTTRIRSYRTVQIVLATVSLLVILRGAGLGIPFISPAMANDNNKVECCHK
jgi:uncharacterized protein